MLKMNTETLCVIEEEKRNTMNVSQEYFTKFVEQTEFFHLLNNRLYAYFSL